jgi:hypothetical protein
LAIVTRATLARSGDHEVKGELGISPFGQLPHAVDPLLGGSVYQVFLDTRTPAPEDVVASSPEGVELVE